MADFLFWRLLRGRVANTAYQIDAHVPPEEENRTARELVPSRAPSLRRAASYLAAALPLLISGPAHFTIDDPTPGRPLFPAKTYAAARASNDAYKLKLSSDYTYEEKTPGSPLFQEKTYSAARAVKDAYRLKVTVTPDFFDEAPTPGKPLFPAIGVTYEVSQGINTPSLYEDRPLGSIVYPNWIDRKSTAQTAYNGVLSRPPYEEPTAETPADGKPLYPSSARRPKTAQTAYDILLGKPQIPDEVTTEGKPLFPDRATQRRAGLSAYNVYLSQYPPYDDSNVAAGVQLYPNKTYRRQTSYSAYEINLSRPPFVEPPPSVELPPGTQLMPTIGQQWSVVKGINTKTLVELVGEALPPGKYLDSPIFRRFASREAYKALQSFHNVPNVVPEPLPEGQLSFVYPNRIKRAAASAYQILFPSRAFQSEEMPPAAMMLFWLGTGHAGDDAYRLLLAGLVRENSEDLPAGNQQLPKNTYTYRRAPESVYALALSKPPAEAVEDLPVGMVSFPSKTFSPPRDRWAGLPLRFPTFIVDDVVQIQTDLLIHVLGVTEPTNIHYGHPQLGTLNGL